MKKTHSILLVVITAVFIYCSTAQAQNVVTSGTTMKIASGTKLVSTLDFTVNNSGNLIVDGSLILKQNFTNQNASSNLSSGTLEFSGSAAQSIAGQNQIGSLAVNNSAGLDINGNTTLNTGLILQSGLIRLGSNNLSLGNTATVTGTPSASSMVVATGTGELRKCYSGVGSFLYPVGDNTGTAEYSPVILNFTGGSFGVGNYASVRLANSAYSGSSANYLNRYWLLSQSGIASPQYNAMFQYSAADVVGDESTISCLQVEPSPIVAYALANPSLHQLTATGLSSFGTFAGMFYNNNNKVLSLNLYLEGLYAGNGLMNKARNATSEQFAGSIADKLTIELHPSSNYSSIAFSDNNVSLLCNGSADINIPAAQNGSYYITVKHRNSIAITSKLPVSFTGNSISYAFDAATKAFGNNLKSMGDGYFTLYSGDANQDGYVDTSDLIILGNQSTSMSTGYLSTDLNGDGVVDALDLILYDNNSSMFVTAILP